MLPFGVSEATLYRALVTKSLYALCPRLVFGSDLEVFAPLPVRRCLISDGLPPFGLHSPSEYHRACPPGLPILDPTALMGFVPLRRLRQSGAHFSRVCLARYVALPGFLSLLALCFSRRLPALFHAGNALGVPPSRAFPPRQAGTTFRCPMPSCRLPPRTARLQGLRPDEDPLPRRPYSGHVGARCSPGLSSPPGSSPLPRWDP
jgi:hypothetical protein